MLIRGHDIYWTREPQWLLGPQPFPEGWAFQIGPFCLCCVRPRPPEPPAPPLPEPLPIRACNVNLLVARGRESVEFMLASRRRRLGQLRAQAAPDELIRNEERLVREAEHALRVFERSAQHF